MSGETYPDYIPVEWGIPICLVLWVTHFVLGSKERREAREARLNK